MQSVMDHGACKRLALTVHDVCIVGGMHYLCFCTSTFRKLAASSQPV